MRIFAAVVLLGLVAGCAGTDATSPAAAGEFGEDPSTLVSDSTGAIQGLVLTSELLPVSGVLVTLDGTVHADTTDESGRFSFALLEPGTYTVRANLSGHVEATQSIDVLAGEAAQVRLTLKAVSLDEYIEVELFRGLSRSVRARVGQECVLVVMPPLRTCTGLSPDRLSAVSDVEPDWTHLLGEMYWVPVTAGFNQWAILYVEFPNTTNTLGIPDQNSPGYFQWNGKSPVIGNIARQTLVDRNQPEENMFGEVGWYGYSDYSDVNTTVLGVGSMLDQPLELILSTFHKAPMPEGYTALPDR